VQRCLYSLSQVLNNIGKVIEVSTDKSTHNFPLRAVNILNTFILELIFTKKNCPADTHSFVFFLI